MWQPNETHDSGLDFKPGEKLHFAIKEMMAQLVKFVKN